MPHRLSLSLIPPSLPPPQGLNEDASTVQQAISEKVGHFLQVGASLWSLAADQ